VTGSAASEALRQAQKMEAVGQLTGGIAHDFNNLLAGLSGSLELLEKRISEGRLEGVGRYIYVAQESTRRAASLTQRLLAFARRQTLDPKIVDVNRNDCGHGRSATTLGWTQCQRGGGSSWWHLGDETRSVPVGERDPQPLH
jgi:phosphoglycerate-specific signal transduction histidine kinase